MMNSTATLSQRRYDLDRLRVFAIISVFIFHSGRFFDQMDWHVKSAVTYPLVQFLIIFFGIWIMPLFFVISGASLYYSVGKTNSLMIIKNKIFRLLVPFVVGVFTHISTSVYLERYIHGQFDGSFLQFYPLYLNEICGLGGLFAGMRSHLWYLLVLFVFTIPLLPVFYLLKGSGRGFLAKLGNFFAIPGMILILALPIAWLYFGLEPKSLIGQRNMGGWPALIYVCFFIYGFIVFSSQRLLESTQKARWFYIAIAFIGVGISLSLYRYANNAYVYRFILHCVLYSLGAWCFLLAFIGFALKYQTRNTLLLRHGNEAVLPFYIAHQTVLLLAGYFILRWPVHDFAKWIFIFALSLLFIVTLYEGLIRRFNALRFLFGMKRHFKNQKQSFYQN